MGAFILSKIFMIDADVSRGWTLAKVAQHIPIGVWDSYTSSVLHNHPISTKAIISASVYTIRDLIAQWMEGKAMGELDCMWALRSLMAGLIGHGPLSHLRYNFSEHLFNHILHWTAWWSVAVPKVTLDQGFWGSIWIILFFFSWVSRNANRLRQFGMTLSQPQIHWLYPG
jgi:protein Mpv17